MPVTIPNVHRHHEPGRAPPLSTSTCPIPRDKRPQWFQPIPAVHSTIQMTMRYAHLAFGARVTRLTFWTSLRTATSRLLVAASAET